MIAIVKFKNKIKKFQISPDVGAGSRVGNVNLVVSDLVQEDLLLVLQSEDLVAGGAGDGLPGQAGGVGELVVVVDQVLRCCWSRRLGGEDSLVRAELSV